MTDLATELQRALEDAGYQVDGVAENRGLVRVTLRTTDASAAELREIAETAVGDDLLGVDVSADHAGTDEVGTALSVRHR